MRVSLTMLMTVQAEQKEGTKESCPGMAVVDRRYRLHGTVLGSTVNSQAGSLRYSTGRDAAVPVASLRFLR